MEAETGAHLRQGEREHLPVAPVPLRLDEMLGLGEGRQDVRVVPRIAVQGTGWGAVGCGGLPHRSGDPRLPVDKRAVAVEGEEVETVGIEAAHVAGPGCGWV